MDGFWASIWRSRARSAIAGAVLSALIASVLYAFNWHTFYDTRQMFAQAGADVVAADIEQIVTAMDAAPGRDEKLRQALRGYLSRREAQVLVTRKGSSESSWSESNDIELDPTRTQFHRTFDLRDESGATIEVVVNEAIRPSLMVALSRAWTFSLVDYLHDADSWRTQRLYNRSLPLYGYLLTVIAVGFGTIRALHRDQCELARLYEEAQSISSELTDLSAKHASETEALRERVREREAQRDRAAKERDRLSREIESVEREYHEIARGDPPEHLSDERLRGIKEKKSRIERELAAHDAASAQVVKELQQVRDELGAAEELLAEVETRHADHEAKLRDRNRQIRKLQMLVREARQDTADMQMTSLRLTGASAGGRFDALEDQLAKWVETTGETNIGFAQHSRTGTVVALFEKIDRDFRDRFFSHANNLEYERGARRIIRVQASPNASGGSQHGEVIVVLDDDAGRTLGLRYDVSADAPDPTHVGFALALLLRARVPDLEHFAIRVR